LPIPENSDSEDYLELKPIMQDSSLVNQSSKSRAEDEMVNEEHKANGPIHVNMFDESSAMHSRQDTIEKEMPPSRN